MWTRTRSPGRSSGVFFFKFSWITDSTRFMAKIPFVSLSGADAKNIPRTTRADKQGIYHIRAFSANTTRPDRFLATNSVAKNLSGLDTSRPLLNSPLHPHSAKFREQEREQS